LTHHRGTAAAAWNPCGWAYRSVVIPGRSAGRARLCFKPRRTGASDAILQPRL